MKFTYRIVTKGIDGEYRIHDFAKESELIRRYSKVGIDDFSLNPHIRGLPVLKGLVGPFPDTGNVLRYESPDVFEHFTKEWSEQKRKRRSRTKVAVATE